MIFHGERLEALSFSHGTFTANATVFGQGTVALRRNPVARVSPA